MSFRDSDNHPVAANDLEQTVLDNGASANGVLGPGERSVPYQILLRKGSVLIPVTEDICPIKLKITAVEVIIDADKGQLEKVVLHDSQFLFHLAANEIGVRGWYTGSDGGEFPDVWYPGVKQGFQPKGARPSK